MRPLIIGTGWCAHSDGYANNKNASKQMYQPDWLLRWYNYHVSQIDFNMFVYQSDCDVSPINNRIIKTYRRGSDNIVLEDKIYYETVRSLGNHDLSIHSHDSQCAIIAGAQYAYCNECDFVYIEQDCLVKGLDKAINWARNQNAKIAYGANEWAWQPSWAEHSFIYISYDYLTKFVFEMMKSDIKFSDTRIPELPEKVFNDLFKNDAVFWPFGYGRIRPIDFSEEIFYAQQLNDAEIGGFLNR